MRTDALAGVVGLAALLLAVLAVLPPAPRVPLRGPVVGLDAAPPFPPSPAARRLHAASRGGLPAVLGLDAEVARLGRAPPRPEPLRRDFAEARDLAEFALALLPAAAAGHGASQYFIYLALDHCRAYLRSSLDEAGSHFERLMSLPDLGDEERDVVQSEYERCRGFALTDWRAVGEALGPDRPEAEVELASVWFERAVLSGYGPALAEQALRPGPYGADERHALLAEALAGGGAEVYWLLFAHSGNAQAGETSVPSLAWLIVACRAGADCTEDARWYRGFACTGDPHRCPPGQSALEYYWRSALPPERAQAWTQAIEIQRHLLTGEPDRLPLPDLERLDYRRLWGRGTGAGQGP